MVIAGLDDVERLPVNGLAWRPIRHALGVTAFGINGYTALTVGDELIERHAEDSPGSGRHEELYLVVSGRATFTVADTEHDAPVGTIICVPPGIVRSAVAAEPETTVIVVGGTPGAAWPPSPFEYWYRAEPHFAAGEYDRAIQIATEGLVHYPDHAQLNYQLACYSAKGGYLDGAVAHLRVAVDKDEKMRGWASDDADLDSIRDRGDFPG